MKRIILHLIFIIFSIELILRLTVIFLPIELKNLILDKYSFDPAGIYYLDTDYTMHIMKPNFIQPKMFYNNYWWYHKTNNIGIRENRNIEQADIVVLGDSMIYGHGVNIENNMCSYLEKISGWKVANLGVQGDYPPFEYIRFKKLGLFLQPKLVLFFINGLQDESDFSAYSPTEAYIDKVISEAPPDYSRGVYKSDYLKNYNKKISPHQVLRYSISYRIINLLYERFKHKPLSSPSVGNPPEMPKVPIDKIMAAIIKDASRLCEINRAKLIIVCHPYNKGERFLNEICKRICNENKILFLDLSDEGTLTNTQAFRLKKDSHYSVEGNEYIAGYIFDLLKSKDVF